MKKNFNKIPKEILEKIEQMPEDDIIVACVKKIKKEDIASGKYSELGLEIENNKLKFGKLVIPNISTGKYSKINIEGKDIVRRDLPKKNKSFSHESPNYGDWSKGSHTVTWDRLVFRRDFLPPKNLEIEIELIETDNDYYIIKFSINEVLNKKEKDFKDSLLYDINLLQENLGNTNIFKSNTTKEDYLKTVFVNWEILPPGNKDENLAKIISKFRNPTREIIETINDRYDLLTKLNPGSDLILGTSGFSRYLGVKIKENFVIFENLSYGNAIYIMFDDWKELSKLSRIELLKNRPKEQFTRIIHGKKWKNKVREAVKKFLKEHK